MKISKPAGRPSSRALEPPKDEKFWKYVPVGTPHDTVSDEINRIAEKWKEPAAKQKDATSVLKSREKEKRKSPCGADESPPLQMKRRHKRVKIAAKGAANSQRRESLKWLLAANKVKSAQAKAMSDPTSITFRKKYPSALSMGLFIQQGFLEELEKCLAPILEEYASTDSNLHQQQHREAPSPSSLPLSPEESVKRQEPSIGRVKRVEDVKRLIKGLGSQQKAFQASFDVGAQPCFI